jgi:hypothetical protein
MRTDYKGIVYSDATFLMCLHRAPGRFELVERLLAVIEQASSVASVINDTSRSPKEKVALLIGARDAIYTIAQLAHEVCCDDTALSLYGCYELYCRALPLGFPS